MVPTASSSSLYLPPRSKLTFASAAHALIQSSTTFSTFFSPPRRVQSVSLGGDAVADPGKETGPEAGSGETGAGAITGGGGAGAGALVAGAGYGGGTGAFTAGAGYGGGAGDGEFTAGAGKA